MSRSGIAAGVAAALLSLISAGPAIGQTAGQYPSKPVRFIVPGPGGLDIIARQIFPGLAEALGQPVVVENKTGGVLPGNTVMTAAPDGYTLLFAGGSHWLAPLAVKDAPYDPVKDFSAIVMVYFLPYVLVIHNKLPVNSVQELIAAAKARPGQINMGAGTPAASGTISGTLFKQLANIDVVAVAYKTSSARSAALLAGEFEFDFLSGVETKAALKSGKIKGIAVSSKKPSPQFPGLPPIADVVPDYEYGSTTAMFAPARTPPAIISRVNFEMNKLLKKPETIKILQNTVSDPMGGTPEEAANFVKNDYAKMDKLLKAIGFRPE